MYMYKISTNCGLQEKQCMYNVPVRPVNTNIVAEEGNMCPVCVFVTLVIQHAMHMRHTLICDLSDCTILCHIISLTARFAKES